MAYFPMYINLENEDVLVVGGGSIATHKVRILIDFGARVTVIAPEILPEIEDMKVICIPRLFTVEDLNNRKLVVAATDDKETNHQVSVECRKRKILVNAVDQQEDCDFLFSSYIRKKDLVASFSSSGSSPLITQIMKKRASMLELEQLSDIAEMLKEVRDQVKQTIQPESRRKEAYHALYEEAVQIGKNPDSKRIQEILSNYQKEGSSK